MFYCFLFINAAIDYFIALICVQFILYPSPIDLNIDPN
ncbi:hypothetical protein C1A50_2044 [Paenibacillus polymyxa]|nr:hypothetical protein C1A50_2044 [Paenibacillus polymyxa]